MTVEAVRGRLSDERADEVLDLWARHGALTGDAARARLAELVCVLLDAGGAVVGVNSVGRAPRGLLGARPVWRYRRFLAPGQPADAEAALFNAAFEVLDREYVPGSGAPMGVCVLVPDDATLRSRPEAVWADTQLLYAGYSRDGEQLRVRWLGPGSRVVDVDLQPGEAIHELAATDAVTIDDVRALWAEEGALDDEEARRRTSELLLVATDAAGRLVGVSSAFLERNRQLGMDLWYYRVFVSARHRGGNVAVQLALRGRELLERRFVTGEDRRGAGVCFVVQNEGLKQHLPEGLWPTTGMVLIGDNEEGDHVRVRFFPGAEAPPPPS